MYTSVRSVFKTELPPSTVINLKYLPICNAHRTILAHRKHQGCLLKKCYCCLLPAQVGNISQNNYLPKKTLPWHSLTKRHCPERGDYLWAILGEVQFPGKGKVVCDSGKPLPPDRPTEPTCPAQKGQQASCPQCFWWVQLSGKKALMLGVS